MDKDSQDSFFTEEELLEMDEHEKRKTQKKPKKKRKINIRPYTKPIIIICTVLAIIIYIIFSPDPIASLYRQNFSANVKRLFPAVYQNKTPIDYTSDELEEIPSDLNGSIVEDEKTYKKNIKSTVKSAVTIPFENASKSRFVPYNSGLLCASSKHIYFINSKGEITLDEETPVTDPLLKAAGSWAVLAQKGGKELCLYENCQLKYSISVDEDIISLNISSNGDVVLVTDKKDYKGGILVYNSTGDQIFSWASGQSNVMCAAISASTRRVAAALANADNTVYSSIRIFDINEGEYGQKPDFSDTLLFDISFSSGSVTAFGDNSMITLSPSGELISDRRFDNVYLSHFAYDMQGNKAVMFDSDNIPVIQTYGRRGNLKSESFADELCDYLCINGKYLLFNSGRDVILKKESSDTLRVYTAPMDIVGLRLLTSNVFAVIHSNCVEIVRM